MDPEGDKMIYRMMNMSSTVWKDMTLYQMLTACFAICLVLIMVKAVLSIMYLGEGFVKYLVTIGIAGSFSIALTIILEKSRLSALTISDAIALATNRLKGEIYNNGETYIIIMISILLVLTWNSAIRQKNL